MSNSGPVSSIKHSGPGERPRFVEWPGGITWIAHPDEAMHRASHALAVGSAGRLTGSENATGDPAVWLIDPIEANGLDERLRTIGSVAGVVVLSGYHRRHAASMARRHDVPVYLPEPLADIGDAIDAQTEVCQHHLPGTAVSVIPIRSWPMWREAALFDRESGTLVVAESLVSQNAGTGPGEQLAVAPYARFWPPRAVFRGLDVRRILVGHGDPVLADAEEALDTALENARQGLPAYLRQNLDYFLRAWFVAWRV